MRQTIGTVVPDNPIYVTFEGRSHRSELMVRGERY